MADLSAAGDGDKAGAALHNQFLLTLNGAVSQAQLYEPDHKILVDPIRRLGSQLGEILRESAILTIQNRDQSVFVNEQRLRSDGPTYTRHQQFFRLLETRKASGLV